jgi:hypothetical protein
MGDFYGLPTKIIENKHLRLEVLTQAGPRIVRLWLAGSDENLFAANPNLTVPTPSGIYNFRGGHRLWASPEAMPRTYAPDNEGLQMEELKDGLRLTMEDKQVGFFTRQIELHLHPDRPAVTLTHRIKNEFLWPLEFAPWAITQLQLGGTAIFPQQVGALDAAGLLPNRNLTLWPYTSWQDDRLILRNEALFIRGVGRRPPLKIGCFTPQGWLAYWRAGVLFVKHFDAIPGETYPDGGCNAEVYLDDLFVELESLGRMGRIQPGQTVEHTERWELYSGWEGAGLPPEIIQAAKAAGLLS